MFDSYDVAILLEETNMAVQTLSAQRGRIKPRLKGLRILLTSGMFRRLIQLAFAAFIAYVTIVHVLAGEGSTNVTASPEALCPFGGLETLYRYITTGGAFVSHTHLSNLVLALAVLITAILLRSAFCGWICPLGFIQDIVHSFSTWVQKRSVPARKAVRMLSTRGRPLWAFLDKYLRFVKYGVLVWAVTGAAIYGVMIFRDYDPWSALINIAEWIVTPGLIILGLTLIGSLFVERPWCRYACPLGAVSGLLGKLSPVYLKREADACTSCKLCTKACPMGLQVHTATTITSVDCISCLECLDVCPREGAMEVRLGVPLAAK
jgi:polyferredoxin